MVFFCFALGSVVAHVALCLICVVFMWLCVVFCCIDEYQYVIWPGAVGTDGCKV